MTARPTSPISPTASDIAERRIGLLLFVGSGSSGSTVVFVERARLSAKDRVRYKGRE